MAIVKQFPCPACGNWTDRALATCQNCDVPLKAPTRKQLADAAKRSDGTLTGIRAEQRRKAEAAARLFPDALLAKMYAAQLHAIEARVKRLSEALENNHAQLDGADDPRWAAWYKLDARYMYVYETRKLAIDRGHVLVCNNHGVDGVPEQAWPAGEIPLPELYEGLSLRGLVTGEGAIAYERYCEQCSLPSIEQHAARLLRTHRGEEMAPGRAEKPVTPRNGAKSTDGASKTETGA